MASIHRDPRFPKGVWYAAYRLASGRRVYRSTGVRNKSQARIIAEAWESAEREAASGGLTKDRVTAILNETLLRLGQSPVERVSVRDWLESWLASKKPAITASSYTVYSQAVREFLGHLEEKGASRRLESISELDVQGFIDAIRASGRSAVTINKLRAALSSPFEKARRVGRIPYNPVAGTSAEKSDTARKETFSASQIAALLRVADFDWQGAILFAYSTGARLGDTANLQWSSLDVANGIVTYQERKTKARAIIGLHQDFLDWLGQAPIHERPDAPVFPSLAGKPLEGDWGLSNTFTRLIAKAGIENRLLRAGNAGKGRKVSALSFHSLRHTAASSVFNSAALKEITRRVTRHAPGGVVDRYIREDLEAIRAAVGLIPRLPK
jgi:integrase